MVPLMGTPGPTQEDQKKLVELNEEQVKLAKATGEQTRKTIQLTRSIWMLTIVMVVLIIIQIFFT